MKATGFFFVLFFIIGTQFSHSNTLASFNVLNFKDGVFLVVILIILAVYKIGQSLLSKE